MRSAQDAAVRGGDWKNRKLQIVGTDTFSRGVVLRGFAVRFCNCQTAFPFYDAWGTQREIL
jgi:hypothetical protein